MTILDLPEAEARRVWQPFLGWATMQPDAYSVEVTFEEIPFEAMWNAEAWERDHPGFITRDSRPGQPNSQYWWASNQGEVSQFIRSYQSRWLPIHLFHGDSADTLAGALFGASRHYHFGLHFNKGLSGADPDAVARTRQTAVNPVVFDAPALLICGTHEPHVYPGVPGHEPNLEEGRVGAAKVKAAMEIVRAATPTSGSYVNEADYFEREWQTSFWGSNYPRLLDIKRKYDPDNLFRVHHGVGSE